MDAEQHRRLEFFSPFVDKSQLGLEVGPSYRPTFPKADGWNVKTLDHCSAAELRMKYLADARTPDQMVSQIEEVDFVWDGRPYREIPDMPEQFDYVVACHVIEHQSDLIQYLQDMSSVLADSGQLLLAVPQRSKTRDAARPLSTLGDVIIAHRDKDLFDLKAWMDEVNLSVLKDGIGCWGEDHLATLEAELEFSEDGSESLRLFEMLLQFSNTAAAYRDGHRWIFEPDTLEYILEFLAAVGLNPFRVSARGVGHGCEFFLVLEKRLSSKNHSELAGLQAYLPINDPFVVSLTQARNQLSDQLQNMEEFCSAQESRLKELAGQLADIQKSRSWRVTRPLRSLAAFFRN